jgi:arylsulfatase
MDPYERADTDANDYGNWWIDHVFLLVPAQVYVMDALETFREFPPRQKPAKFNLDEVMEQMQSAGTN